MAKIVIDNTASGYNLAAINSTLTKIALELNTKVLYRDNPVGEPNQILQDIDVNGKNLLNVNQLNAARLVLNGVDATDLITGAAGFASQAAISATNSAASAALSQFYADQAGSAVLPDGSVTTIKLGTSAVTGSKIAAGTITQDKFDPSVAFPLADSSVTQVKLAANSVSTAKLLDGAVLTAKLADQNVTAAKLALNMVYPSNLTVTFFTDAGGITTIGNATATTGTASRFIQGGGFQWTTTGLNNLTTSSQIATYNDHGFDVYATDLIVGCLSNNSSAATTNTSKLNAFLASSRMAGGGKIIFPAGDFFFSGGIVATSSGQPYAFEGQGQEITRLMFTTGSDGITFNSSTQGNGFSVLPCLTVRDLALCKAATASTGGHAIIGAWPDGTDNRTHFICENVNIYSDNGATQCWTKGIELFRANGTRIHNVMIKGDVHSTSFGTTWNPYACTQGIHYVNPTNVNGCINHFISNISGGELGNYIQVDGWFEGMYIDKGEAVHVNSVFTLNGFSTSQNPNFFVSKVHGDFRNNYMSAQNMKNIFLHQCDVYHDGLYTGGAASTFINLTNCDNFEMNGGKIANGRTDTGSNGILVNSGKLGRMHGVLVDGMSAGTALALGGPNVFSWNIGGNTYNACTTGIFCAGNINYIADDNIFVGCTNKVQDTGSGNRVPASSSF